MEPVLIFEFDNGFPLDEVEASFIAIFGIDEFLDRCIEALHLSFFMRLLVIML